MGSGPTPRRAEGADECEGIPETPPLGGERRASVVCAVPVWKVRAAMGLVESMADAVPDALHELTGVERNHVYRLLRLQATPTAEGYEVSGALTGILHKGIDTLASVPKCKTGELSFHAWLSQGDERLELTRA